jgi:hypothetical protein
MGSYWIEESEGRRVGGSEIGLKIEDLGSY